MFSKKRDFRTIGRNLTLAVGMGLLAAIAAPSYASPPSGYSLSWSDEFNQGVNAMPNSANWNFETGKGPNNDGWGNWEQQTYVSDQAHCHIVSDSQATDGQALQIQATNAGGVIQSAKIDTANKVTPQYGYIELRAKLPYSQGMWPCFWLLGTNIATASWPGCGEMDMMEMFGQNAGTEFSSYHMGTMSNRIDWSAQYVLPNGQTYNNAYHTFGLLWNASGVTNYIDGVQIETYPSSAPGYAFNHPFYMLLNLAVGGIPPGNANGSTVFPMNLLVDYIRIYQPTPPSNSGITSGVHYLTPACAPGYHLDDSGGKTTNGNPVLLWQAGTATNQQWNFTNVGGNNWNIAVNLGPYCLDDMGGPQGKQVGVWGCSGNSNQTWTSTAISGGYQFYNVGDGLCLDDYKFGASNNAVVDTWQCNTGSSQTWIVN